MRPIRLKLLPGLAMAILALAAGDVRARDTLTPLQRVASTPKGELKSPYPDDGKVAAEGHKLYMSLDCSSCHGGGGGGGMAPPLTNPIWIYGSDGDTLFRLITLGSLELLKQGYSRKGSEAVVGPMPPFGETIKTEDDLWKVIAWIRSVNPPPQPRQAPASPN